MNRLAQFTSAQCSHASFFCFDFLSSTTLEIWYNYGREQNVPLHRAPYSEETCHIHCYCLMVALHLCPIISYVGWDPCNVACVKHLEICEGFKNYFHSLLLILFNTWQKQVLFVQIVWYGEIFWLRVKNLFTAFS